VQDLQTDAMKVIPTNTSSSLSYSYQHHQNNFSKTWLYFSSPTQDYLFCARIYLISRDHHTCS